MYPAVCLTHLSLAAGMIEVSEFELVCDYEKTSLSGLLQLVN